MLLFYAIAALWVVMNLPLWVLLWLCAEAAILNLLQPLKGHENGPHSR